MRDDISSCTKTLHDCYIIRAFSPTVHDIDLCKIGVHSVRSLDAPIPAPTNHTIFHSFSDPFLRTISLTCSSLPFRQFVARPILPTRLPLDSPPTFFLRNRYPHSLIMQPPRLLTLATSLKRTYFHHSFIPPPHIRGRHLSPNPTADTSSPFLSLPLSKLTPRSHSPTLCQQLLPLGWNHLREATSTNIGAKVSIPLNPLSRGRVGD